MNIPFPNKKGSKIIRHLNASQFLKKDPDPWSYLVRRVNAKCPTVAVDQNELRLSG
jgi:hypothetical protein